MTHGQLRIKIGTLESKREVSSTTIAEFVDALHNYTIFAALFMRIIACRYSRQVARTYCQGTYRYGPMHAISVVGTKQEECGAYMPDLLDMLRACPFVEPLLPWSSRAITGNMASPQHSDDGPILWCRPGEQCVPTDELSSAQQSRLQELSLSFDYKLVAMY